MYACVNMYTCRNIGACADVCVFGCIDMYTYQCVCTDIHVCRGVYVCLHDCVCVDMYGLMLSVYGWVSAYLGTCVGGVGAALGRVHVLMRVWACLCCTFKSQLCFNPMLVLHTKRTEETTYFSS